MFSFPLRVLLVSSDHTVYEAVRHELEPTSAELAWKSSRQAISRRDQIQVILWETKSDDLDEISRMRTLLPGIPIVVLQSKVDYQWGLAAIRQGASDYLGLSEIVGGNLFRVLRFWVERWKVERALQQSDSQLIAVQRMEGLGRTVAGVAHDFRHFLQVVYSNCHLIKQINKDPSVDEMADEIKLAGEKANRLIKQMLDFAQGTAAARTTFDIGEKLSLLEPLYRKLLRPGVEVESFLGQEPLSVELDSRFEQVVMNLIANSVDAIDQRGSIIVELRPLTLERDYLDRSLVIEEGSYAVLSVSDTGQGIDARDLEQIFDPFFTTKGRDVGTGLGLSVVFSFMQEWRGHVLVASIPGKGTTFHLVFPRSTAPACAPVPSHEKLGLQVLINEPNEALQLVLRRDLTALGCESDVVEGLPSTLALKGGSGGVKLCPLSPRLMDRLGLIPAGCVTLAAPFCRSELAQVISSLAKPGKA